jgi:hypothetical protein
MNAGEFYMELTRIAGDWVKNHHEDIFNMALTLDIDTRVRLVRRGEVLVYVDHRIQMSSGDHHVQIIIPMEWQSLKAGVRDAVSNDIDKMLRKLKRAVKLSKYDPGALARWIEKYGEPCPGGCSSGGHRVVIDTYPGKCGHCGLHIIPSAGPSAIKHKDDS